jgi:pimeloyl-ACP methyl ester carboxylesterase
MVMKRFDVEFTKRGRIHDESQVSALLAGLSGVTDLFVISHGWNNDMADARRLYDKLVGNIDKLLALRADPNFVHLAPLASRTFAVCQIFWPSKKFTDEELIPGGGAASTENANKSDAALETVLDRLAEDPDRLGDRDVPDERKELAKHAKKLIPQLDTSEDARTDFVTTLRKLLDSGGASRDDASIEFFNEKPSKLFKQFEGEVVAPGAVSGGGATAAGSGGAAGVRDMLEGARAAARRIANFATYYQMKERAGTVGSKGVAEILLRVRKQQESVRLHLVGHSFGGRLVTAAAHAFPDSTPAVTLSLLQAAYSHNGLSANFLDGQAGSYRDVIAKKRASGPIIITHTKNDKAVGIAYPLASRVAFQKGSALGAEDDPYGGMGRNGAQKTNEVADTDKVLKSAGQKYGFAPGAVYNLLADEFIADHSAIHGPEVAYAVLAAARALP